MKKEKPEFLTKPKVFGFFFGRRRKLGVQPEAALKEWQEVKWRQFVFFSAESSTQDSKVFEGLP